MGNIKCLHRLNGRYREEIRALEEKCNALDQSERTVYLSTNGNTTKNLKCFYLYYEEELKGFLALTNIDDNDIELNAFVDPEYRRRGVFKKLVQAAFKECKKSDVSEVFIFQRPFDKGSLKAILSVGAEYLYSEYQMELSLLDGMKAAEDISKVVTLHEIKQEQKEFYTKHMIPLFQMSEDEAGERFEDAISEPRLKTYIAYDNEEPVGFFSLFYGGSAVTLFDVGICEEYQGKGYGNALLRAIYDEVLTKKEDGIYRIILHVSSYNEVATHLYKKHGFQVKDQLDCYKIEIL
ncbi:GNAT family N-acetyltransferase [Clostridium sp. Marseille-P299]|uniref:GNAT family N-acetyltransferase n=1 Tax=Clostridium sp. Marseille-P299 TaxID=1805477 RepID=UPI00082AD5D6|nr:GNAT family N-acetyltransferase [Clostridium sp. Marseille-P299]